MKYHLKFIFHLCLLLCFSASACANEELVIDADGNEIRIEVYPGSSDFLIIWLVDHQEHRPMFEKMLEDVSQHGISIWRVNLLESYFIPRSSENVRTLPGDGVFALIKAAHEFSNKQILLAGYERLPLTILRGIRKWQLENNQPSRLAGAILFYPNLFGPPPVAGEDPQLDPVVYATNIPLIVYQPEFGSQRWRLQTVMEAFWTAGAPAYSYIVPGVRDWFFMGETDHGSGDKDATRTLPAQLQQFGLLLKHSRTSAGVIPIQATDFSPPTIKELVKFPTAKKPPGFNLTDAQGTTFQMSDYQGKVTLVNFWATWCPPCVEEIPSLNRLQERYQQQNFEIISIDYRETVEQLQTFTTAIPVNFPILMDNDGQTALNWKVFSFPSSFLLDRQGMIRYSANRAIDWDTRSVWQAINELMEE